MDKKKPRIIIMGYGRHGKDTAAELIKEHYGLTFESSSKFVGLKAVWPKVKDHYNSFEECYEDRHNHRKLWHDLIAEYNSQDKARLGKELFSQYDMYVGLRSKEELEAILDWDPKIKTIWIHRPGVDKESDESCKVQPEDCEFFVNNCGDKEELFDNLDEILTYT